MRRTVLLLRYTYITYYSICKSRGKLQNSYDTRRSGWYNFLIYHRCVSAHLWLNHQNPSAFAPANKHWIHRFEYPSDVNISCEFHRNFARQTYPKSVPIVYNWFLWIRTVFEEPNDPKPPAVRWRIYGERRRGGVGFEISLKLYGRSFSGYFFFFTGWEWRDFFVDLSRRINPRNIFFFFLNTRRSLIPRVTSKRTNTHWKHEYPNAAVTVNRARAKAATTSIAAAAATAMSLTLPTVSCPSPANFRRETRRAVIVYLICLWTMKIFIREVFKK